MNIIMIIVTMMFLLKLIHVDSWNILFEPLQKEFPDAVSQKWCCKSLGTVV